MPILSNSRLSFFLGVNTGYVTEERPDARLLEFYRLLASPGLYCSIVGNVVIPDGYGSNVATPRISKDDVWSELAKTITAGGTLPGIQLSTAWKGYTGATSFRSKHPTVALDAARSLVSEMSFKDMEAVLGNLELGSEIALSAGFRHLQLHAAHGYLFSLLVDKRLNRHADKVLVRIAEWAKAQRKQSAESSIRFSLRTGAATFDAVDRDDFQRQIAELPVDFVDVSSGFYNIDKRLIYPSRADDLLRRREETLALAMRFPTQSFIFSGRSGGLADTELPLNVHVGLCRDLIANPNFLSQRKNGCVNSGKCHYFSRGKTHMECSRWSQR